jgi:hypothetical protein
MSSPQKDMFKSGPESGKSVRLVIKNIPAPRRMDSNPDRKRRPVHFHIPSFKNSKRWVTKTPQGKPLNRPLLITSPEFQRWMEKAVLSFESQLLSLFPITSGGTQPERSRLFAIVSSLPEDDSVRDFTQGSWTVKRVQPGEEGAEILIERL